jgi:8-amino-7-oxononanoate synthase
VSGSDELIEYLVQKARPYIYTTALPPAVAQATRESLRLVQRDSWRREHLATLVSRFRAAAGQLGLSLAESCTPIQPLIVGDSRRAVALAEGLFRRGLLVRAIRPPTVPAGSARLRITLSAAHKEKHVDRLVEALAEVCAETEGLA